MIRRRTKKEGYIVIAYIKGPLAAKEGDMIVVEAGSIGYNLHVPQSLLEELPSLGEEVRIYTYLQVKEDSMTLYGFGDCQGLKLFKQLLGVNGIGPKGAMALLSSIRPNDLRLAIASGDAKAISRAPGIGLKTAQRVILDLKDRISMEDILGKEETAPKDSGMKTGGMGDSGKEAIDALVALGYSALEAAKAVRKVEKAETMTAEEILKSSLKYLI